MYRYFPCRFRILILPSLVVIHPRSYTRRMTSPIAVNMPASLYKLPGPVIGRWVSALEGVIVSRICEIIAVRTRPDIVYDVVG